MSSFGVLPNFQKFYKCQVSNILGFALKQLKKKKMRNFVKKG